MNTRHRYTTNPCEGCKVRHRKCDGKRPCAHCIKSKTQCESSMRKFKFKDGRRRRSLDFSPNQRWVDCRETDEISFINVLPEGGEAHLNDCQSQPDPSEHQADTATQSASQAPRGESSVEDIQPAKEARNLSENKANATIGEAPLVYYPAVPSIISTDEETASRSYVSHSPASQTNVHHLLNTSFPWQRDKYPLGPLKGLPGRSSDTAYTDLEEACLIRHFTENLAPWFDTCDRDRHFQLNVPQRAIFCPVLRYAILTASAGHLTCLATCRGDQDCLKVGSVKLTQLSVDTAVRYHDICISYLLELSKDPREQYNEDVLTAATILRFYEQIDAPSIGIDSEAYLNTVQFIVNSQQNDSFYAYHTIQGPPRDLDIHCIPSASLRHSACLIALRQEIWSGFLNQRTFRLPVCPSNDYTMFDSASDFTWTNRILVWCADLLKFCFGEGRSMAPDQQMERWSALRAFEAKWEASKPLEFKPLYYEDANPRAGKFFPVIWHENACQVVGAQHIELSRILLAVSNPRLSRLGVAARSKNLALEEELRCIIRRIVGLALSNPECPVVFVDAAVGISVCGEYIEDPLEQHEILEFLANLEFRYAWPTAATAVALKEAWKTKSIP